MQRNAGDHEQQSRGLDRGRDLRENRDPDDRGRRRQQADEQRVGRARQALQRELVADVGNDRRGDPDADPRQQGDRVGEHPDRLPAAHDARLSIAELGRRVGLSSPAVAERLKRLEGEGVITGYRAEINPRALGLTLGVIIRIRPHPRQIADVAQLARDTPEVVECHRVTGEDCYVMTAYVRDVEHLEAVIDQFVAYGQTTSSIMQSAPVPRRGVSLDAP